MFSRSEVAESWWVFVIFAAVGAGAALGAVIFFPGSQSASYYEGKIEGFLVSDEEAAYGERELLRSLSHNSTATVYLPPDPSANSRASVLREISHNEDFAVRVSTALGVNPKVFSQSFSVDETNSLDILKVRAWGESKNRSAEFLEVGLEALDTLNREYFPKSTGDLLVLEQKSSNPMLDTPLDQEEAQRWVFRFIEEARTRPKTGGTFGLFPETSAFLTSLEGFVSSTLSPEDRAMVEDDLLIEPLEFSISESGLVMVIVRQASVPGARDALELLKREFLDSPGIRSHDGKFEATVLFGSTYEPVLVGQLQSVDPTLVTTVSGLLFGLLAAGILVRSRVSRQHRATVARAGVASRGTKPAGE